MGSVGTCQDEVHKVVLDIEGESFIERVPLCLSITKVYFAGLCPPPHSCMAWIELYPCLCDGEEGIQAILVELYSLIGEEFGIRI